MKYIFTFLLVGGLIALSAYEVVQLVLVIKNRKNAKSDKKENDR